MASQDWWLAGSSSDLADLAPSRCVPPTRLLSGAPGRVGVGPRLVGRAQCRVGLPSPPPASVCQHLDFKVIERSQSMRITQEAFPIPKQYLAKNLFTFPLVRSLKSPVEPSSTHHLGPGRQAQSRQRPRSHTQRCRVSGRCD